MKKQKRKKAKFMANIHLKTAGHNIRRSPFQAASAIFVLAITFFVVTFLAVLTYSSSQLIKYFETRPQVIAFLKEEVKSEDVSTLKTKLEADERVDDVSFVSKEEALNIYKKATADNPLLSELVSPSIFPASIEFSLKDLSYAQNVIDEVKGEQVVEQVGFTASLGDDESLGDVLTRLRNLTWYLRVGGGVFALILVGTSFLILVVIIGMRMTTRRGEVEILDLIGATPGFIRSPIIYEAIIYATAGVFIGWLLAFLLVLYSTPSLIGYFGEVPVLPRNTKQLFILFGSVLGIELFAGLILAVGGSILAVSRVKRKK
jgi:cell division transport system permease protein